MSSSPDVCGESFQSPMEIGIRYTPDSNGGVKWEFFISSFKLCWRRKWYGWISLLLILQPYELIPVRLEHRKKGQQALGRSRGWYTNKIHLVATSDSTGVYFVLSAWNDSDCKIAEEEIIDFLPEEVQAFLADKGYDTNTIRKMLEERNILTVIPSKRNRKKSYVPHDTLLYKMRNFVERIFRKMKNMRRVFSRYDKLDYVYASFVSLSLWCLLVVVNST